MTSSRVGLVVAIAAALAAGGCKQKAERRAEPAPPATPTTAPATDDPWGKPEAAKDPLKQPLLWSMEKDGKTSYLFGTMHLGVDPHTRLPDVVWDKLDAAKVFAMETDLASASNFDILQKDGMTLQKELGPEYWKKLEDALGPADAARVLNFKPMIPASLLSKRGLPDTPAMDGVLHGRAINQNKQIVFLEPFELQAAVLLKWMNAQALKDMLDDIPGLEERSKQMLAAYLAGDAGEIVAIADSERDRWQKRGRAVAEYDQQMEDLLYKRNASWIAPIEKAHADGPAFIAVGALHLIGPRSVVELLEKAGYKVTRITP
jgi:uncharacterized protein